VLSGFRGVHDQILAANRTPVVWEEMLLQWNVTLNKEVLVQVWQSAANIKLATSKGYKVTTAPNLPPFQPVL
jgi:hexosaminidase